MVAAVSHKQRLTTLYITSRLVLRQLDPEVTKMGAALFALVPEVCCTAWHDGGGGGGGRPFLGSNYALLGVWGGEFS